jgi:hypothetical protein
VASLFGRLRDRIFPMREDLASSSFLAVIVVCLCVVCAGLIALGL